MGQAVDEERRRMQREVEELREMLRHREQEQVAQQQLAALERQRDAARLDLLEAELSLTRNQVSDMQTKLDASQEELAVSEHGRQEALSAAAFAQEELVAVRRMLADSVEDVKQFQKERNVYEAAARKAAQELVNLRLVNRTPSWMQEMQPTILDHAEELLQEIQKPQLPLDEVDGNESTASGSPSESAEGSGSELPLKALEHTTKDSTLTSHKSSFEQPCGASYTKDAVMRAALELAAAARKTNVCSTSPQGGVHC